MTVWRVPPAPRVCVLFRTGCCTSLLDVNLAGVLVACNFVAQRTCTVGGPVSIASSVAPLSIPFFIEKRPVFSADVFFFPEIATVLVEGCLATQRGLFTFMFFSLIAEKCHHRIKSLTFRSLVQQ